LVEIIAHFGQIVIVEGRERGKFRKPIHGVHVGKVGRRSGWGSRRGGEGVPAIGNTGGSAERSLSRDHRGEIDLTSGQVRGWRVWLQSVRCGGR
jgi:hypothetical protein